MPDTISAVPTVAIKTIRFETGKTSPCVLARKLIEEGKADRNDRLVMLRNGKSALSGGVGWFADRRIQETATGGPRYVKWRPFPGVTSPAQAASNDSEAK